MVLPARNVTADGVVSPEAGPDPLMLYGPEIDFDVFRKGDKVGFHRVRFERVGEDVIVSNTFQVEVDVLFFTAFRFVYQSEARWRHGQLMRLEADVNDNGKMVSVEAVREGGRMTIRNAVGQFVVDAPLYPTNHWNASVLPQTQVLNTLTGRVSNVSIEPRGREEVSTEWGDVAATRYAYTGDIRAEVWYDDAGRWVKLRFQGRDGSDIDYVCRRCQGTAVRQAAG